MKKILGLVTALLLASPVMGDVAITTTEGFPAIAWVVIDDEVYWCRAHSTLEDEPVCYKAEMKD